MNFLRKISFFPKFLLTATQTTIITVGIAGVAQASPYFVSIDFDTDAIGNLGNPFILTQTDDNNNSFVYDDLVFLAGVTVIPEPTTTLGLLGFSAIGFGSLLKHKKQRFAKR